MVNKIRRYFESGQGRYNRQAYETFKNKIADGCSLRDLSKFLEGAGLKVSHTTIRRYIETLETEYKQQRKVEKLADRAKEILSKIKPMKEFPEEECQHLVTESFFSVPHEAVFTRCKQCGMILDGSYNPSRRTLRTRQKEELIFEALRT